MSRFSSDREKRLWLWVAAAVVAVYSGLALAGTLGDAMPQSALQAFTFGLCFLVVVVAVAGNGLSIRPERREIWVAVGVAATYGMLLVRMGVTPAERTHLFEYGLVATLTYQALSERRRNGGNVPVPPVLAFAVTGLLGWLDEAIQSVMPGRVYSIPDVGVNVLAALLAIGATVAMEWARGRLRSEERAQ